MTVYRINATIDAADEEKIGMNAADFFRNGREILTRIYETMEEADKVAHSHYLGPDVDGIGASWEIERAG